MPVPVPRRPSPSPSKSPSISTAKNALRHSHSPIPDSLITEAMNGFHSEEPTSNINGGLVQRRKRHGKKNLSTSSLSSGASDDGLSSPSSERSTSPTPSLADGIKTPRSASWEDVTFEEWQGIMKRIVEEWEIPRKVLHSSIGMATTNLQSYLLTSSTLLQASVCSTSTPAAPTTFGR